MVTIKLLLNYVTHNLSDSLSKLFIKILITIVQLY